MSPPDADFRVVLSDRAKRELRRLMRRAIDIGIGAEAAWAVRSAILALASTPKEFGNPVHKTKLPNGTVCHGNNPPFFFRFALFETQRAVIVYEIRPLPSSSLDLD